MFAFCFFFDYDSKIKSNENSKNMKENSGERGFIPGMLNYYVIHSKWKRKEATT